MKFVMHKPAKEDGLKRKISITLPYKDLAPKVNQKLEPLAAKAKVDGFRPGKVPLEVVKRQYGEAALKEVASELMRECFLKLAVDEKIKLAGILAMQARELAFNKDFTYEVEYEVYPEIDATVPADSGLEKFVAAVADEDIDKTIDDMRQRMARYEDTIIGVEARPEHLATVSYTAVTNDAAQEQFDAPELPVDLAGEHPGKEFVAAILGMRADEQKQFTAKVKLTLSQPADANNGGAAPRQEERDVNFNLTLKKLQRRVLPPVDRDFFKQLGVEGSEQDFRAQIRSHIDAELRRIIARITYKSIAKVIMDNHKDLEVPSTQLQREASRLREAAIKNWTEMTGGRDPAAVAESLPLEMFNRVAYEKVSAGLFLSELAKDEVISDQEVEAAIDAMSPDAKLRQEYKGNKDLRAQVYNTLWEERALAKFLAAAGAPEKRVSYLQALAINNALNANQEL